MPGAEGEHLVAAAGAACVDGGERGEDDDEEHGQHVSEQQHVEQLVDELEAAQLRRAELDGGRVRLVFFHHVDLVPRPEVVNVEAAEQH